MPDQPRVMLIHALRDSIVPSLSAFAKAWPEARVHSLVDDSLSTDLAAEGELRRPMIERFLALGRYAAGTSVNGHKTKAILFTCSAFGTAIEEVKRELAIPVLTPNEAAFEDALDCGRRIALLVTFEPALKPLRGELEAMARRRGQELLFTGVVVAPALVALQAGQPEEHDRLIADAAAALPPLDALILGQFSAARAAALIAPVPGRKVFTTPAAAVAKLRRLVA